MFSAEVHYLVIKEKHKKMQQDSARHHLIQSLRLQQPDKGTMLRSISGRIGTWMVTWGLKLQHIEQSQQQSLPQQSV